MLTRRHAIFALSLALAGCVSMGPPYRSVAAALPPVPAGKARIFFYRWLEIYETTAATTAFLNGPPVGLTETGSVLYRDVEPGQYTISVVSQGVYPNQFKTVTVGPGQVIYARIESIRSWSTCGGGGGGGKDGGGDSESGCYDTFVVQI